MRYYIYKHTSPNGKVYIGCTRRNPKVRWGAGQKYYYNKEFFADIKYYGWDNIEHTIIQYYNDKKRAFILEQMWISYYRKRGQVYNITDGGAGSKGTHCSEENKVKASIRMKLSNPMYNEDTKLKVSNTLTWRKGKSMSEENRKLQSERMKLNNPMKDPEIANRVAETKRGKHLSEEHKQKMSKPVIIEDIINKTKVRYKSITEAAKAINSTPGNVGSVLKGNHKLVKHQYKAYYDDNSISIND
nr:homing endonuclease [Herelleviridae sp.]